jgi:hypothetical protein
MLAVLAQNLQNVHVWIVPMWNGNLESRTLNGWLDGTGLTVKDYWGEKGDGGEFRRIIDAVRAVATQQGWSHEVAKSTVRVVVDLSGSIYDLKTMPDHRRMALT